MSIILAIVGFIIAFYLVKGIWYLLKGMAKALKYVVGIVGIVFLIFLFVCFWEILLPLVILYFIGRLIYHAIQNRKKKKELERIRRETEEARKKNQVWISENITDISEEKIAKELYAVAEDIYLEDTNDEEYKFVGEKIPYGRVNAFLNYHGTSLAEEEPYYYSAYPSMDRNEFREYGMVITDKGIYVSTQKRTDNSNNYIKKDNKILFSGAKDLKITDSMTVLETRIDENFDEHIDDLVLPDTISKKNGINKFCRRVVEVKWGVKLYVQDIMNDIRQNREDAKKQKELNDKFGYIIEAAGLGSSFNAMNEMFAETKGYMNGSRGGGYAAEYANNTFDRVKGQVVESTAQVLDAHGRQVKGGADRTVGGQQIQTKYYKTANESVGAAFSKGEAIYIRDDGSGKMMAIEVPRDQYQEAIRAMQKRIDRGEVPNVEPGEDAATYVRKGYVTYSQAWNVAKAGTLESLTIDAASGAVCTSAAAGISGILVFAQALWNGADIEDAVSAGLHMGINVLGKGMIIYTVSMQLSRNEFANYFSKSYTKDGVLKGFSGVSNPIYHASENIANAISNSYLARSQAGEILGLNQITGKGLISGTVVATVTFGPDLCKALSGRISVEQLLKNSIIGATGLVGAGIGQMLIPIPVLGGIIGGSVGGFVMKNFMDSFVEDDALKMFQILKEEFLDRVIMAELTKEEFDQVVNITIGNEKLSVLLQDMYASGEYREYARVAIVDAAIVKVVSGRRKITDAQYMEGMKKLLSEAA